MRGKEKVILLTTTTTWIKDSHSLFDYESPKILEMVFESPILPRSLTFYREKNSKIIASESNKNYEYDPAVVELILYVQIEVNKHNNKVRLNLYSPTSLKGKDRKRCSEKQKTNESAESIAEREEEPYVIVSKLKMQNSAPNGCKLLPGMIIKLGRIEYYVSEYNDGNMRMTARQKGKGYFNGSILRYESIKPADINPCKICLEDTDERDNFLFNPCKCFGSCGTVHFNCLKQWIHIKVKKDVIGGTMHYNFEKFECEVCKTEFPGYVDAFGVHRELLELELPSENYIMLEGACEKEKSIMIIQNTPPEGIKLGRGHECEIRITDISVSRKHAHIRSIGKDFYIFDNKSKFGTLIRENGPLSFELKREKKAIQVGRTIFEFEMFKSNT